MSSAKLASKDTRVEAVKSQGETMGLLMQFPGVSQASYLMADGKVCGISFSLKITMPNGQQAFPYFEMPVRTEQVKDILGIWDDTRAEQVAWRHIFYWVKAQLTLVQTGQVETARVFMPYCMIRDGYSTYDAFIETTQRMLPAAKEDTHDQGNHQG